jgi:regulator of RNase E activity RraA
VVAISAHGATDVALWGEPLSTAARARGAVGVVADGLVRDSAAIASLRFLVFSRGTVPYDIHGRLEVVAWGVPATVGDLNVRPGELVVADADGVVFVPAEVESEVVARALEKATRERGFRDAVAGGMKPSEAYALHGVL